MIRNIIFDWSGTLVDDLPAVLAATNYVCRRAGLNEFSIEQFRAEFCLPFKKFYDRHMPQIPMATLEEWFHSHFRQVQAAVRELPHARAFLELCQQQQIRQFILSTVHPEHFHAQAQAIGFNSFFEAVYVGVMDKKTRIGSLLTDHQLLPSETLFIGDMQHDIDTAKAGGTLSCAVLTGYTGLADLRASDPDLIVEHLGELRTILQRNGWNLQAALAAPATLREERPVVTVGAAIFNRAGEVLVVRTHKWSNLWGIPGGKVQFGETSIDALRREIVEETGLQVTDIEFVMVQDCIRSTEFYREAHFVLLNYQCTCDGQTTVQLNDEAQEFQWVRPAEAVGLALNQPTRLLLERIALHGSAATPRP